MTETDQTRAEQDQLLGELHESECQLCKEVGNRIPNGHWNKSWAQTLMLQMKIIGHIREHNQPKVEGELTKN